MPEKLTTKERSALMSRVRSKHTRPEKQVRQLLSESGYRFRLHARDLPGHPDIVFRSCKKVIFVHGCFWHQHRGCRRATVPVIRAGFWKKKFQANMKRDRKAYSALKKSGWGVLVVWECQLRNFNRVKRRLNNYIAGAS